MNSKLVLQRMFTYNACMQKISSSHPAAKWLADARLIPDQDLAQLRLAAMAGHMRMDKIAARRAALIDLLADGRPHRREEIWADVAARLEMDCWGQVPQEALARDLKALRRGGVRIAYSRRAGAEGYYLAYPPLAPPPKTQVEAVNWTLVEHIRQLTPPQKNEHAFAAAAFALQQKRLLLAEAHPAWSANQVERAARDQVFGAYPPMEEV